MKKLSIFVLAIMPIHLAIGADWVEVGGSKANGQVYYVDKLSVKKINIDNANSSNQIVSYFGKIAFNTDQKIKKDSRKYYKYEVTQFKGDCENNKTSKIADIFYTSKGVSEGATYLPNDVWKIVFPDTAREMALNYACYIAGYRSHP